MRFSSSTADEAEAGALVDEDVALAVLQVDLLAQLREEDDRELQALGVVDGHDAARRRRPRRGPTGWPRSVSASRLSRNLRKR